MISTARSISAGLSNMRELWRNPKVSAWERGRAYQE